MTFSEIIAAKLDQSVGDLVGKTGGGFSSSFDDGFQHENLSTARIYPERTEEDPLAMPLCVYTIANTDEITSLSGSTGVTTYDWGVGAYGKNYSTVEKIAIGIRAACGIQWRDDNVMVSELTGSSQEPSENGMNYLLTFKTTVRES